jgi:hypothetical protein
MIQLCVTEVLYFYDSPLCSGKAPRFKIVFRYEHQAFKLEQGV